MKTEIISYQIKDFKYRTPVVEVNDSGEAQVSYANEKPTLIPKITFLYQIHLSDAGEIQSAKSVDVANSYLMHLVVNKEHQCVSSQSRALIQYFSFLSDIGMQWDEMPVRPNKRPTYRFKSYLEDAYRDRDVEKRLSVSTSKTYMRNVVNFYRFLISKRVRFDYPPFEHEIITVNVGGSASHMKATRSVSVQTTDLRLRINKQEQNEIPNRLRALSDHEWNELDTIIRRDRRVIRNANGSRSIGSLAIETSLMLLLMRYSGLRRSEVTTFNESLAFRPTKEDLEKGYINLRLGGFCGIKIKNNKEREVECPSALMLKLFEYKLSKRHLQRKEKYADLNPDLHIPLFLNNRGKAFSDETLNARWSEIRATITERIGREFQHKAHNLRATYGVFRLKSLMRAGLSQEDALSFVQHKMGHEDLSTTLSYLKQTQTERTGAEMAEQAYDHLFDLAGVEF